MTAPGAPHKGREDIRTMSQQKRPEHPTTEDYKSEALRELLKFHPIELLHDRLKDLVQLTPATRSLAEKMDNKLVGKKLLQTSVGQSADEVVARWATKTRKVVSQCFPCNREKKDECTHSTFMRMIMMMSHLFFRFFPPFFLLRWCVDIALFFSELLLAFCYDLAVPQTPAQPKGSEKRARLDAATSTLEERKQTPQRRRADTEPRMVQDETEQTASKESVTASGICEASEMGRSRTLLERIEIFIYLVFIVVLRQILGVVNFFIVHFIIPILSLQVVILLRVSNLLHFLAGLDNYYNTSDKWRRDFIYLIVIKKDPGYKVKQKLRHRDWLTDRVIDRCFGDLLTLYTVRPITKILGIKRPLMPLHEISDFMISVMKRNEKSSDQTKTTLVPYLRDDTNYDESRDPDYVPEACSEDDSLEYKEDELDCDGQEAEYDSCETGGSAVLDSSASPSRIKGQALKSSKTESSKEMAVADKGKGPATEADGSPAVSPRRCQVVAEGQTASGQSSVEENSGEYQNSVSRCSANSPASSSAYGDNDGDAPATLEVSHRPSSLISIRSAKSEHPTRTVINCRKLVMAKKQSVGSDLDRQNLSEECTEQKQNAKNVVLYVGLGGVKFDLDLTKDSTDCPREQLKSGVEFGDCEKSGQEHLEDIKHVQCGKSDSQIMDVNTSTDVDTGISTGTRKLKDKEPATNSQGLSIV